MSCSYDEGQTMYDVDVQLSEALDSVTVEMRNNVSTTFTALTDKSGMAHFSLPAGIYSASVSKVTDDGFFRNIYNGSLSDIVVGDHNTAPVTLPVTHTAMQTANPIVIKELYVGGCQKDDGSGIFARDKCIILYNNSSVAVSLDSVAIGMVEPYNGEATHQYLSDGKLLYADEDWIPAINGIWYFQDGHSLQPYSEMVINIHGAIDNTQTYTQSVSYANADYYCMYDPEYMGPDGRQYANTMYYPAPSELIPTSHYLKTVKYGQGNAWPFSQVSPTVVIFKPQGATPAEYASNTSNITYPPAKQGNVIYACLKLPRAWVIDAVEVFNAEKLDQSVKRLTPDLDNGYIKMTNGQGHSLIRKVERTVDGHNIYQDTNNSTNDFYEADKCSLR